MLSRPAPTSTVVMPRRVAVIGPIVEPQGTALFETNDCVGTPAAAHARMQAGAHVGKIVLTVG